LILLDEPFTGLDMNTCDVLVEYLKTQKGKVILISSHSIEWTKKICDKTILLERGEIVNGIPF